MSADRRSSSKTIRAQEDELLELRRDLSSDRRANRRRIEEQEAEPLRLKRDMSQEDHQRAEQRARADAGDHRGPQWGDEHCVNYIFGNLVFK